MNQFFLQFGIDWKLFVSQLVNFVLILVVLRTFVYRPLMKVLNKRRDRIEEGLVKAKQADQKMQEIHELQKEKLRETEREAVAILTQADAKRKKLEAEAAARAKEKEGELIKKAESLAESRRKELYLGLQKEAGELVKSALAKATDEEPDQIDE